MKSCRSIFEPGTPLRRPRRQLSGAFHRTHGRAGSRADPRVASTSVDAPGSWSSRLFAAAGWSLEAPAVAPGPRPSRSRRSPQPWHMPKNTASTIVSSRPRGTHAPRSGECAANSAYLGPGCPCFRAMHEMDASTMLESKALVPGRAQSTSGDARCGWSNLTSARHWA
jgi:hypothetical protein